MSLLSVVAVLAVTAGWENIAPARVPFPAKEVVWVADFSNPKDFSWELREGAQGSVEITPQGVRIAKTNDAGYIVVKAKTFKVEKGRRLRCWADQESVDADVDYASGVIRGHGRTESLAMQWRMEGNNFWHGGLQTMRGLPCTPPGMSYRKYGDFMAEDDVFTPVILVSGTRSTSFWKNWTAEDLDASAKAWKESHDHPAIDYTGDMIDEAAFDRMLAADSNHVAEIRRIDGVSRLVADGKIVAPMAYMSSMHVRGPKWPPTLVFAGKVFNGSDVKIMVKPLTRFLECRPNGEGVDYKKYVGELKATMRMAPNSLFIIGLSDNAPRDFISKYHPEEAWINEKGEPVVGTDGSCSIYYRNGLSKEAFMKLTYQWPSPSSRVWRDWMCRQIRGIVAEIRAQGLDKRVVGMHIYGYHDAQNSVLYTDHSKPAQEEYARMIAEPGCISTNYAFCMKQAAFRAQEEFMRAFKEAIGKPSIGIMWCESPFQGNRGASLDVTSFCRSDVMDVIVCQPNYRERMPGFPTVSAVPLDSFHLHGKMFWNEYDYRTYSAVPGSNSGNSPISEMSLGTAADIEMWRTMYRKVAGEADATRMGYWLYDMRGGFFRPPEIAADIRELVAEETRLARLKPSKWKPDMAIVLDEAQILQEGENPLLRVTQPDEFIYASSCRLFGTCGVPYQRFLAEDALASPEILNGKKIVVLAFFREIDARRAALLKRLAAQGTTLVHLSETGVRGGAEATGFQPIFMEGGKFGQEVVPEPGVTDNVTSLLDIYLQREKNCHSQIPQRCTVSETEGVKVLARYASDGLPAIAERHDVDCRRVYVAAAGGLTPGLLNRIARESGAFYVVDSTGLQVDMNGNFMSVHCLRPGRYTLHLPFPARVENLKSHKTEKVTGQSFEVNLTAGETCRFLLEQTAENQSPNLVN